MTIDEFVEQLPAQLKKYRDDYIREIEMGTVPPISRSDIVAWATDFVFYLKFITEYTPEEQERIKQEIRKENRHGNS